MILSYMSYRRNTFQLFWIRLGLPARTHNRGPSSHGEISSINLTLEQGIMIIYEVLQTMQTIGQGQGQGQDLLRMYLLMFQHASGLSLLLLEYVNQQSPHLEGHYYVYLQKFLAEHNCQLEFACVKYPQLERRDDWFIIDIACHKPRDKLDDASIRKIHYCHSYLQVHRLSYICTVNGCYILPSVIDR